MDEVSTGLFVGTVANAGDEALLEQHGVDRVVCLTHRAPSGGFPDGVSVSRCAMLDGPRNQQDVFRDAVEESLLGLQQGETILVHCSRGASRSPSVAAVAIALHEGIDIAAAFERVGDRRDGADPHEALVRQAVKVYQDHREVTSQKPSSETNAS